MTPLASLLAFMPLAFPLAVGAADLWYAVPLIVVVSLVYAATRYESRQQIVAGAVRMGTWICGFMLVLFVVLALVSWQL